MIRLPSDFASSTLVLQPSARDGLISATAFTIKPTRSTYGITPSARERVLDS